MGKPPERMSEMDKNEIFEAKNKRMVEAIQQRKPYWLLISGDDWYYALIQIESDRIPVPVLLELFGKDKSCEDMIEAFGYGPEVILDRDIEISGPGEVLTDIVSAMMVSAKETGKPDYSIGETGATIFTGFPEDSSKSDNGGDYYYYRRYRITAQGVEAQNDWSCDFSEYQYKHSILFKVNIGNLKPLFERAEAIVVQILNGEKIHVCPTCGHPYSHSRVGGGSEEN